MMMRQPLDPKATLSTAVQDVAQGRPQALLPTHKRLEEGTYAVPFGDGGTERRREITAQELGALLSGIDLSTAKRRKRYRRDGI